MAEDLSPFMKERLRKWKENTLQVKSAENVRGPIIHNRRALRGDYGDDIRDFEIKQEQAWVMEQRNNPNRRGNR